MMHRLPGPIDPVFHNVAGGVVAVNCTHFRGDRPCAAGKQGLCANACSDFAAMGRRVLVIKLGALGDVIRTAALLPGIRDAYSPCQITWVTRSEGARMLSGHPLIERVLPLTVETMAHLLHEEFDLCLSLDKEPGPAGLAMRVRAAERRGIGLTRFGTPIPLNPECEPYFTLGLDDALKFRGNRWTYPELIYAAVGLPYRGQRYTLHPPAAAHRAAERIVARARLEPGTRIVGLNTGAGGVFANKTWPPDKFIQLARSLRQRDGVAVGLLGGPREAALNREIAACAPGAIDLGCDHDEPTFASLVSRCAVLVTGDTMALHVGVAMEVPVVAIFGPTCEQEIDLFGRGEKIVTSVACAPCYRRECNLSPTCMDDISLTRVAEAVERWLPARRAARVTLPLVEAAR